MGKISQKTKQMAVGEVLSEQGTLVVISEKYGISSAYLSSLASRVKRLLEPKGYKIDFDEATLLSKKKEKVMIKTISSIKNAVDDCEKILNIAD